MPKILVIYLCVLLISATIVCFEIISTRISSVIFVNNYAFIILSLAILGLGVGGIFSHYRIKAGEAAETHKVITKTITLIGISLSIFIVATILFPITNPFVYFFLIFLPFFLAGIVYSQFFKIFAGQSFILYAFDLSGAALGSLASIFMLDFLGAPNSVIFLSILIFCSAVIFMQNGIKKIEKFVSYSILILFAVLLIINGNENILGRVPIGNFPEKDFYYVYPDAAKISQIIESRWSIHGRSDLVQYNNQDMVKQLFIDGAAGTQMYRFDGNIRNPDNLLSNLLLQHTSSIPFLFLTEAERNNMLVIGPGGGKEILIGLLGGVEQIIGVEINPDFVDLVKKYGNFNGGIYTDFPNVQIDIEEGRHYVKKTEQLFDLIVMALPSTEQLQSIDNFAMSENYLLTIEAIQDYLKVLTPEGRLIFTVHNNWELLRLVITAITAFEGVGVNSQESINHFLILEEDYAPTIIIKKNPFSPDETTHIENISNTFPKEIPPLTFLPFRWENLKFSDVNKFLLELKENRTSIDEFVKLSKNNITPCRDDNPYFYKIKKGIPKDYLWLFIGILFFNLLIIGVPYDHFMKKSNKDKIRKTKTVLILPSLLIFLCIGAGFMIIEVSLFQKLILFLGSPTISLSVLLSSLLIGMGAGSYFGKQIFITDVIKRLTFTFIAIATVGILLFAFHALILESLLRQSLLVRSLICFALILPFGLLLGVPFPASIQFLKQKKMEEYIPWMYGINGGMSVLGSIIAVNSSMLWGFSLTFFIGVSIYFFLFLFLSSIKRYDNIYQNIFSFISHLF